MLPAAQYEVLKDGALFQIPFWFEHHQYQTDIMSAMETHFPFDGMWVFKEEEKRVDSRFYFGSFRGSQLWAIMCLHAYMHEEPWFSFFKCSIYTEVSTMLRRSSSIVIYHLLKMFLKDTTILLRKRWKMIIQYYDHVILKILELKLWQPG